MVCEHTDPWRGPEGVPTVTQSRVSWFVLSGRAPENLAN